MSYPGNNSLAAEIKERILTTFEQTLDLAARGELPEAGIGCDFILRLDPMFEPASRLKERLAQGEGALLVDDLRLAEQPTPEPTAAGDVFDLAARGESIGAADETPETAPPDAPTETPPVPPADGDAADAADGASVFSDMQAQELEAALDWSALSRPAEEPAETAPIAEPAPTPPRSAVPFEAPEAVSPDPAGETVASDESVMPAPPAAPAVPAIPGGPATPSEPTAPTAPDEPGESAPPLAADPTDTELMATNEPLAVLDSESEQRIQELLGEGQTAFDGGQYQSAIDAWSRIFLVDIDHNEASRRIELARKLKAEVERQVEELYHEGVSQVEQGDFDGARENFGKVLEMQGSHLAAQEYLEKLDAGTVEPAEEATPAGGPPPAPEDAPADTLSLPEDLAEPASDLDGIAHDALEMPSDFDDLGELGELAAEPATERPRRERPSRPAAKPAKSRGIKRSFIYIGGAVLVLAAAASWFLYRNFDDTFPNAGPQATPTARPRVDVIARAQQVFDEGNAELAVAQLKRLPPNHARYAEAQALIAQWETPEADSGTRQVASPEQLAERDQLVAAARGAFDSRRFLESHRLLTQAAAVTALSDEGIQLQTAAALELQPLRSEIEIFKQGEWAEALRSLWQMRQTDPSNPDVRQLMVDSYYNLGVRELQRRDPTAAAENLQEALDLAGDDPEVERILGFAESYQNRPVDLLYRIFVKYLPFR